MEELKCIATLGHCDNYTIIISKHYRWTIYWYSRHTKSITEVQDVVTSLARSHELWSKGCHFHILVILEIQCLIHQMNVARDSLANDKVMIESCILVGWSTHKVSSRFGMDRRKILSDINRIGIAPVVLDRSRIKFKFGFVFVKSRNNAWNEQRLSFMHLRQCSWP
jgi:hypothetical protein